MYYLSGEIFALAVSYNEPWFMDSSKYFVGPGDQVWPDQSVT
jgi:ceramide synthetase